MAPLFKPILNLYNLYIFQRAPLFAMIPYPFDKTIRVISDYILRLIDKVNCRLTVCFTPPLRHCEHIQKDKSTQNSIATNSYIKIGSKKIIFIDLGIKKSK